MDYKGYTYKELLIDDFFLDSQISPSEESRQFWHNLTEKDKELALEIEKAQRIIHSLPYRRRTISADTQQELFSRINREIERNRKWRNKKRFLFATTVAASMAVLCVIISRVLTANPSSDGLLSAMEMMEKPVSQTNQIQLIQPGNEELIIEGTESVIHYDDKGLLSINDGKVVTEKPDSSVQDKKETTRCHQLVVPPGKRSFLVFSDGTQMWVNANSRVVYPEVFEEKKREIYVEGEIFLKVAPDKKKPFVVRTNQVQVNVLGTSFNISVYDDEPEVVLVAGKVNVETKDKKKAVLAPHDMFHIKNGEPVVCQVDVDNHISWHRGSYIFDNEAFSIVLKKLSRYYGVEIVYDQSVEELYCSGTLDLKEDIFKLLKGLGASLPISFIESGERIIVNVKP